MSLALLGHPFSSYSQKILVALWADGNDFNYRLIAELEVDLLNDAIALC